MDIPGLPSFRDLGGHRTGHGTVIAPRLLFRSVDLSRLEPAGGDALDDLGIRRVADLCTTAEIEKRPDLLPDGMGTVHLDVLADSGATTGAQMAKVLADPRRLTETLGGGAAVERMTGDLPEHRDPAECPAQLPGTVPRGGRGRRHCGRLTSFPAPVPSHVD